MTARGDRQEAIFLNDEDRQKFVDLLAKEVKQQDWICYAYCLMDNHYHLLIETPQANLVAGMRRLNGDEASGEPSVKGSRRAGGCFS